VCTHFSHARIIIRKRSIEDEPEEDDEIYQNGFEKNLASQVENKEFITVRHILTQNGNNN